ncbi:hypothetical protein BRADI_4g37195v3 [Brachypodium distachyon]|uniref:F-box domain-containing protein n=1 Tax=Brachypodium distachyon TaxID=15368 RepID=A0A0Q3EV12_BRADI|nr:hypothetical protein BRADI_4g37195v3 [Brachypodium distachyon]
METEMGMSTAPWSSLPDDLLGLIRHRIASPRDRARLAAVCCSRPQTGARNAQSGSDGATSPDSHSQLVASSIFSRLAPATPASSTVERPICTAAATKGRHQLPNQG